MKQLIKKLLREGLEEATYLNLSKQFRNKQKKGGYDKLVADIFGKGVYRLYYDVKSGKQITPTRHQPKLKFDVNVFRTLESDVETILNKFDYTLVDLDKNIAKNNKNNQTIKISKALANTDLNTAKMYTQYLDALTNEYEGNENLYVVISRHSHDIGNMGEHAGSCEDLSDVTDIKGTLGSGVPVEGYGSGVHRAIEGGLVIFYLVTEGDWNIQKPIARFLEGHLCDYGNSYHYYGKYNKDFIEFIREWAAYYNNQYKGTYNVRTDNDLFSKSSEEIRKILDKEYGNYEAKNIFRGLIKHERYDVIYDMLLTFDTIVKDDRFIRQPKIDYHSEVPNMVNTLTELFGVKIFKQLPKKLTDPFFKHINDKLNKQLGAYKSLYRYFSGDLGRWYKDISKLTDDEYEDKYINSKEEMAQFKANGYVGDITEVRDGIIYGELGKITNPSLYNEISQIIRVLKDKKIIDTKNKNWDNDAMKKIRTHLSNVLK